jgi:hypothetical protein
VIDFFKNLVCLISLTAVPRLGSIVLCSTTYFGQRLAGAKATGNHWYAKCSSYVVGWLGNIHRSTMLKWTYNEGIHSASGNAAIMSV